jgi:predicted transcriptional regulator
MIAQLRDCSKLKIYIMQLTKAEEQIMQILWDMKDGLVKDIRDNFSDPKPARNTVSTVLRVLEKKGYVGHKAYGNVHLYHPLISKSDYSRSQLFGLMEGYFNNSFPTMASFFAREKDLSVKELDELLEDTRKELSKGKKRKSEIPQGGNKKRK